MSGDELVAPSPAARSKLATWLLAARLPTLPASIAPVIVGIAVAIDRDVFSAGPAIAALLGAVLLQVAANFANDLSDFRRGADDERIGPTRVTTAGLLSEREVLAGTVGVIGVAAAIGLYLAAVAGWPVIAIGLASIAAALAYTGGPWPFGYRGLGELFVFIFFGLVAVGGTYFVQAETLPWQVLVAALPVACTVTAILEVNNIRDIDTDERAGKYTVAVYLGRSRARVLFVITVALAYVSVAAMVLVADFSPWSLLALATLALAASPLRAVLGSVEGPPLNAALRGTARLHLALGLLLSLGILL